MRRITKSLLASGGVLVGMLLATAPIALGVRLNLTDSLPRGLYIETHERIGRGSLVVECLPLSLATFAMQRGWLGKGSCASGVMPILKQVAAVAGDEVEITDAYVAVNGQMLWRTRTLHLDSQGRWVPAVPRGTRMLKEGEVFLMATSIPNSWDGRYTGPAQLSDLVATVQPVWTEEEQ
jgi:conjugative transfer signal peptidase TraF